MNNRIILIALALLLLLAGCSSFGAAVQPGPVISGGSGDPEAGGGQLEPLVDDAGGGQDLSAGAQLSEPAVGAAEELPAAAATPVAQELPADVVLPELAAGDTYQLGALTFTLDQVQPGSQALVVQYTLHGVPPGAPEPGDPLLLLPSGGRLAATGGSGGGAPDGEIHLYSFPALPAGTSSFTLLLENQWSGAPEVWQVPVLVR